MKTTRTVVGVDTAKRVFQLHWVDMETGEIEDLKLTRAKFLEHFANRMPCVVAMEACGGSHHWARELRELGHDPWLLPAKAVRPFVSGNKNDAHDARAIWTAAQMPGIAGWSSFCSAAGPAAAAAVLAAGRLIAVGTVRAAAAPFRARAVKVALQLDDLGGESGDLCRERGDPLLLGGDRGRHRGLVRRQPPGQRDQRPERLLGLRRQAAVAEQAGHLPAELLDRAGIGRRAHSPASTAIIAASTASRSARGIALYRRPQLPS